MKKHLHLTSGAESPEISPALDARILAAAAFKANAIRHRKKVLYWSIAAAAAFLLITGTVFFNFAQEGIAFRQQQTGTEIAAPEMLALSDMTALEQGNYTVAIISEYDFASDNTII